MAGPLRAKLKVEPPTANPVRLAAGRRLIFGLVRPRLTPRESGSPFQEEAAGARFRTRRAPRRRRHGTTEHPFRADEFLLVSPMQLVVTRLIILALARCTNGRGSWVSPALTPIAKHDTYCMSQSFIDTISYHGTHRKD